MEDKIALLMGETGCERGEAELALEICDYDLEKAVRAIPRLFQNIAVVKGRVRVEAETLFVLFQAVLDMGNRAVLRARAVASYNPAVFAVSMDLGWFEFEKHLYAGRLRAGSLQPMSLELELILAGFFASEEAGPFYAEGPQSHWDLGWDETRDPGRHALSDLLAGRFAPDVVRLELRRDVHDMGQFREIKGGESLARRAGRRGPAAGALTLRIALEGHPTGTSAGELRPGDLVHAQITDARDIARYLARFYGAQPSRETALPATVESVETSAEREVKVRVRFSPGVLGEVALPKDIKLLATRKKSGAKSWWRHWI